MSSPCEVLSALAEPDAYPDRPAEVSRIDTHISALFFTERHVYKVKKPVRLPFLDFSTVELRRHFCEEEVRLNSRLSPSIYLGVVPITRASNGSVHVSGSGEIVDHAVKMIRLPGDRMMDQRLARGEIDNEAIHDLVSLLASFHQRCETGPEVDRHAEPQAVADLVTSNLEELGSFIDAGILGEPLHRFLTRRALEFLSGNKELFSARVAEGRTREGHGDLHAANICFTDVGIQIYDCIEFAESFRCSDVAADLAFLAMDLDLRGFRAFSRYLVYRYGERTRDPDLAALIPFYKGYRALVRAKVAAIRRSGEVDEVAREESRCEALRYLHLAASYELDPVLVLMCGLPASGKSWAARAIAKPFDGVLLRSDLTRRRAGGKPGDDPDQGLYRPELVDRNYDLLLEKTAAALDERRPVIVDATFGQRARRERFRTLATARGVRTVVVYRECDEETTRARMEARALDPTEPSDADLAVFESMRLHFEAPDPAVEGNVVSLVGEHVPEVFPDAVLERVLEGLA